MSSNIEATALSGTRKCRILAKCFAKTRKGDKRLQTIIAKRFVTLMDKRREARVLEFWVGSRARAAYVASILST